MMPCWARLEAIKCSERPQELTWMDLNSMAYLRACLRRHVIASQPTRNAAGDPASRDVVSDERVVIGEEGRETSHRMAWSLLWRHTP